MFIEIETDFLSMTVDFDYKKGTKDFVDKNAMQWYPGDAPDVKLKGVWVRSSNEGINILSALDSSERHKIEQHCLEAAQNEEA